MVTVMELASASSTDRPNLRVRFSRTAEDDGESVEGTDVEIGEQPDFREDLGGSGASRRPEAGVVMAETAVVSQELPTGPRPAWSWQKHG